MKSLKNFIVILITINLFSCQLGEFEDIPQDQNIDTEDKTLGDFNFSSIFNWENTQDTQIAINTKDNAGNAIKNVRVSVWSDFEEEEGIEIINGVTNDQGEFNIVYEFSADITEVVLKTNFIGFVPEIKVPVTNGSISHTFGGIKESHSGKISKQNAIYGKIENTLKSTFSANVNINYLGTFDNNGVPNYLEPERDYISGDFLNSVNAALPERNPVPTYHPEYLETRNQHNLIITDEAEVWVTFVSEGAGYKNVLAYYTYDRDFPPQSPEDITDCYVIFPNTSFAGSGGGLYSGDKVSLGTFSEGTVIGWMLMRNGWKSSSQTPTEGLGLLYSNLELNPEPNIEHRQHSVLLYEEENDVFLIGFEDLIRPGGDNDFNDAIFYATANPIENVQIEDILIANPEPLDADSDNIFDSFDDYPLDATMAFNNYYPGKDLFGTLAFEDNWPSQADYDFNDLVIDYNFNSITDNNNDIVSIEGKFVVRAIGASFENGFGFTLDNIAPASIASVTGTQYTENYIQTNANGTEAGQSSATIIIFDNAWEHGYSNTRQEHGFIDTDTISVKIDFVTPISATSLDQAPFNPFIIVNKERGREIHLADHAPSDLVDTSFFGYSKDNTIPGSGTYYKTSENLPWGLNFPSKFDYPIEQANLDEGHLNFIPWALSEGQIFKNWYKNEEGYRDHSKIYQD
ncbi:LruC domain-containing protein [Seonamhaeicola sp. ML3]|uniref:LruC domain-containing protein n=1 Tax=Seonamhaeicola sp. ML3 TaxID=2937786 RepID=UPI00200E5BDF|nr:LruC domain-containing protein [Seonamhaeicola sp. ML3]